MDNLVIGLGKVYPASLGGMSLCRRAPRIITDSRFAKLLITPIVPEKAFAQLANAALYSPMGINPHKPRPRAMGLDFSPF